MYIRNKDATNLTRSSLYFYSKFFTANQHPVVFPDSILRPCSIPRFHKSAWTRGPSFCYYDGRTDTSFLFSIITLNAFFDNFMCISFSMQKIFYWFSLMLLSFFISWLPYLLVAYTICLIIHFAFYSSSSHLPYSKPIFPFGITSETIFITTFAFFTYSFKINREPCYLSLTLSRRRPLSYRNQSIDLLCKSMDRFLYNSLRRERVNRLVFGYSYTLST